jgi:hypothetical protein
MRDDTEVGCTVGDGVWGSLGVVRISLKLSGDAGVLLTSSLGPEGRICWESQPEARGWIKKFCSGSLRARRQAFHSPSFGRT